MIAPVDRTAEFLADLRSFHVNSLPQNRQLQVSISHEDVHPFQEFATQVSAKIVEMREFVLSKTRSYEDFSDHGMKDEERDEIDSAIAQFLRSCVEKIERLKSESVVELERRGRNMSFAAHKLGVIVILNGKLQRVSELSEELRGVRINHAIEQKSKPTVKYDADIAKQVAEERRASVGMNGGQDVTDPGEFAMYEQIFAQENASLRNELIETRESVREAERTTAEVASLNHVLATNVLEQAKEIEVLYDLAVESTMFVERGNRELRKLRDRGPNVMKYMTMLMGFLIIWMSLWHWLYS
eukprot:Plantae.Rhodophyta-Hildenbrandia_rubra.ctg4614.p3 GENE.Plantae.Rhodophyta-Hildenbrandia_rubra.ctg4614~~Plantae.Rhodophyta-Hildenbrandia_rubra.ctg4614.p3  ORF type:complete len:299 (-),score=63.31 Plantae.Rhodophyta-Hildenbrandia_rubra.ctg4614:2271-3167(-)